MRWTHMIRYYWRRNRGVALLFAALMLVVSTLSLVFIREHYSRGMIVFENGIAHLESGYSSLDLSFNYSFLFTVLAMAVSIGIFRRERPFYMTASSTRWEFMLGLIAFIALYAMALTGLCWLIGVINRLEIPMMGMRVRQSISMSLVLTGGNADFAGYLLTLFAEMLAWSGWATLIAALFTRWWKQILALMGAGIVVMIVMGVMLRFRFFSDNIIAAANNLIVWLEDVFIPTIAPHIERVFVETRAWVWALRYLRQAAFAYALVYPIMLRMKIK